MNVKTSKSELSLTDAMHQLNAGDRDRRIREPLEAEHHSGDPSSFFSSGRIGVDARTQTDLGLLRAYFRVEFSRRSGNQYFGSGSALRSAYAFGFPGPASGFPSFSGVDTVNNKLETGVGISAAFVQWGGLTAGRTQSFFDFFGGNDSWYGLTESSITTQALAYTYTFGNGISATLSIEDPKERQIYPIAGSSGVGSGGILPTTPIANYSLAYPFAFSPYAAPNLSSISYTQRETIPDIVGVLNVTQAWGSAQVSGAYHRISSGGSTVNNLNATNGGGLVVNPLVPTVSGGYGAVGGNGFGIQGALKLNLPMIAAGDTIAVQAAYSKGAISYVDSDFPPHFNGIENNVGGTTSSTYDAVVGPSGHLQLTPADRGSGYKQIL
ncbi:Porin subfamily protein [Rhizobiales bacterium GAS191]|nr:Porin subfamily protein [Rhizobiales bacterium GAS113]SEE44577.1 Porin subfamily protein [Rhizobiales bacterium GAS191]